MVLTDDPAATAERRRCPMSDAVGLRVKSKRGRPKKKLTPLLFHLDDMLPTEGFFDGYRLAFWDKKLAGDDIVALSRHGERVYTWRVIPNMLEVWDKIRELESVR